MSTPSSPSPDGTNHHNPWIQSENHKLLRLRDHDHASWPSIASIMKRTVTACQSHYYTLRQVQDGSMVDWTARHDHYIIDGRRRGLSIGAIAQEMSLTTRAVQDRWYALIRHHQVPEEVLALTRRKEEVVWSEEEDRLVLGLWLKGYYDEEIVKQVKFRGKSNEDVRARRTRLVNDHHPMYLEMLGVKREKAVVKDGLEKALGKKKYSWM